jgi:hypothetical protein
MPPIRPLLALIASLASALLLSQAHAAATLKPYRSDAELGAALDRWQQAAQVRRHHRPHAHSAMQLSIAPPTLAAPAAAQALAAQAAKAQDSQAGEQRAESGTTDSITNLQTAGVDEGGIVKRAGDHLIILRRGRLFSVRVGGDQLRPVAMTDAFAPGSDPRGAWYDELLVSGRTVVVVGYSYERGGTEIGLFELGHDGSLAYRATHHLRSFDYYSARNYASRLVGRQLIFYSPTVLQPWGQPWAQMMPAQRRWGSAALPGDFERILPATRVFRTDDDFDPGQALALHTVTRCDLGNHPSGHTLDCESSAVLGPVGRVFYVSQGSVYVWTQDWRRTAGAEGGRPDTTVSSAAVFRLPLDGALPTGLKTAGVPTDQMSFLEDSQGHLNVLLREEGSGEGMWGADRSRGRTALLRVPLSAFGDGRSAAQREHYRRLPGPSHAALHNRFVGDWLLWGAGQQAWATRFADDANAHALNPGHTVERIEALGEHALLVGNDGSELNFSAVRLARGAAHIAGRHSQAGARQGESRSHGFFYRSTGPDEGLLGLPVVVTDAPHRGGADGRPASPASVVVLRQRSMAFTALGELQARPRRRLNDRCKASCVDWYGNARPIFLGQRVLALMGYELVEGRLQTGLGGESIEELRRVNFSPRPSAQWSIWPTPFE